MKLKNILKLAGAFGIGYGIGYLWKTAQSITEQDVKDLEEETNDEIFDEEIAKDFDNQDQNTQQYARSVQTENGDAIGEMMKMMGQMMANSSQNQENQPEAPTSCNDVVDPAITVVNSNNEVEGTAVEVKDTDECCDAESSDPDCHYDGGCSCPEAMGFSGEESDDSITHKEK